jgi:hypothetical protein
MTTTTPNEIRELNIGELDAVTGAGFWDVLSVASFDNLAKVIDRMPDLPRGGQGPTISGPVGA